MMSSVKSELIYVTNTHCSVLTVMVKRFSDSALSFDPFLPNISSGIENSTISGQGPLCCVVYSCRYADKVVSSLCWRYGCPVLVRINLLHLGLNPEEDFYCSSKLWQLLTSRNARCFFLYYSFVNSTSWMSWKCLYYTPVGSLLHDCTEV